MQPGPSVLVASRQVQNAHTGLDLSVPTYQEVRGKMMSGHVEYQVVVVTRLPAFKSPKHRPDDVVQFMVSKKYSEIEEFYQKLMSRYPQAALPLLPRKILFVGESDIRERRAVFNDIMRQIAKDGELVSSPELLEFLGTKPSGASDLIGRRLQEQEKEETDGDPGDGLDFFQEPDKTGSGAPLPDGLSHQGAEEEEEEEEEEVLDPLGIMRTKKPKKPRAPAPATPRAPPAGSLTIFEEAAAEEEEELFSPRRSPRSPAGLRLFEAPDLGGKVSLGDSLLWPAARERPQARAGGSDRLGWVLGAGPQPESKRDLDEILSLGSQAGPPAQAPVPPKPAVPKKPVVAAPGEAQPPVQAQALSELDILKYIQDQTSAPAAAPSLF